MKPNWRGCVQMHAISPGRPSAETLRWMLGTFEVSEQPQRSILLWAADCITTVAASSSPVRKAFSIVLTVPEGSSKPAWPILAMLSSQFLNSENASSIRFLKWVTAPRCSMASENWLIEQEASTSGKRLPKWAGLFNPLRRQTPNKCSLRYS